MNSLYLLIVVLGSIGGYAGPLPYGMDECQSRAVEMQVKSDAAFADPAKLIELQSINPNFKTKNDFQFICVYRNTKPALGDAYIKE